MRWAVCASLALAGCGLFLDDGDAPAVAITPGEIDFGMIAIGSSSARTTFAVSADGATDLGSIEIDQPEDYSVVSSTCDAGLSGPDDTCVISVEFAPRFEAPSRATLSVNGASAELNGSGFEPGKISLDPGALSFGDVDAGTTSQPEEITVTNISDETFQTVDLTVMNDAFAVRAIDCNDLEPDASCELEVSFQPPSLGPAVGNITVLGYDDPVPEVGVVSVSGNGVLTQHTVTVTIEGNLGGVTDTQGFIDCRPGVAEKCAAPVDFGVTLTLTAAPEINFQSWEGACASEPTHVCELLLDGPKNLQANFGPAPASN
jgi:hypothetical protein